MELALQLMPIQEAEFLDAAREFLNQGKSEVEDWDFVLESVSLIHHQQAGNLSKNSSPTQ
jgi:hypothetical protein